MREKRIEQKLMMEVRRCGGMALKFVSPSYSGMPDRLILLPDGKVAFVEVKAPGKKPRPLQIKRHEMLRKLGFRVFVLPPFLPVSAVKLMVEGESHAHACEEDADGDEDQEHHRAVTSPPASASVPLRRGCFAS